MNGNFLKDLLDLNPDRERELRANFILQGYSERAFLKLKQGTSPYTPKIQVVLNTCVKKLKLTVPEYEAVNP